VHSSGIVSIRQHSIFSIISLQQHSIFSIVSLRQHSIFSIVSLQQHSIFSIVSLRQHSIFSIVSLQQRSASQLPPLPFASTHPSSPPSPPSRPRPIFALWPLTSLPPLLSRQASLYTRTATPGECRTPIPNTPPTGEPLLGAFLGQTCGASPVAGSALTTGLACLGDGRRAGDAAFASAFAACGGAPPAPPNATAVCGARRSLQPAAGIPSTRPGPVLAAGVAALVAAAAGACAAGWA
jgi:hypothetical protein